MAGEVRRLGTTPATEGKLGNHGVDLAEAGQTLGNAHAVLRNSSQPRRRLLVGLTDGGRALTLVIEPTGDPASWLVITGWESSPAERRMAGL